ncbi:hypothetical protein [Actinokineospora inagensis]|uniref:hypothetical protein n=1 Tax=Actinokineospora inagensis TaxID=103730 RepID=UPI00040CD8C2|nr:hypothetical protein [Actinokineospora inagensis]
MADLPPYRALLVVDVKGFGGVESRNHAEITERVPLILRAAFQRCGLGDDWDEKRFGFTTGDGYAAGFPSTLLPRLLKPLLQALQDELDYRDRVRADPVPLRMRVSVNVGPVTDTGEGLISEGSGTARVETHRLLDAEPVKALLARSGPNTRVVAVVSARAFHDAVAGGYTDEPRELYVPAPVAVKELTDLAYLRVPSPTGDLLREGFLPRTDEPVQTPQDRLPETTNSATNVRGNVTQGRDHINHNINVNSPSNINSGSGPQLNGSGTQYYDHRSST